MILEVSLLLAALIVLTLGAEILVRGSASLALRLQLSPLFIGLTVVAFGTSSPELAASLTASYRGSSEIAIGNVLGSNIFNVLGVLGVCAVARPQLVASQVLWLDLPVMLAVSIALLPIAKSGGRISRGEGAALVGGFAAYLAVLAHLPG